MAKPSVFVSSTCYDLGVIRAELRPFIEKMGYEPVMSDYTDILYNPDEHSHLSCVKQIVDCDLVILIVGSRFGGKAVTSVVENIDFDKIRSLSIDDKKINKDMSITQAEVITAIANNIPLYPFIDRKVYHEQHIYEKNKNDNPDIVNSIHFPSIEKQKTAPYIFDFIAFIRSLPHNNGIYEFSTIADIKTQLTKQWAAYFKELLRKRHHYMKNEEMAESLSDRFDDLKEAIISTIDDSDKQDKIRQITTYRLLISFVAKIAGFKNIQALLLKATSWDELTKALGITKITEMPLKTRSRPKSVLLREKDHYLCHYPIRFIYKIEKIWDSFAALEEEDQKEIIASFSEKEIDQSLPLEHINKKFE